MKKIKFEKKLSLQKETIGKLTDEQLNSVNGGVGWISRLFNCGGGGTGPANTVAQVTCDPANCPTQGCYSAAYC